MGVQLVWSFLLICLDILLLATNTDYHETWAVCMILIGDWCVSILSWTAATASAGVIVLFRRDTKFCKAFPLLACDQYEKSVFLAFMAWSFMAASALSLVWFRASL
ncbi:hypothetical protein PR202_ga17707 [Eleusine coracana subsp. coracana]|uniref:CASP-like protein n=1 Tax=Eleusine coracana subsp. coracana TaxID=191504 RepID=A0AAV5CR51_ELECO|nr:hypothetical protein QOZ80_6AG0514200 [Eleusine coracana subsp. coracana]GJN00286.1 hypothetical protein PR202_ga17460 [Eleusine coracana subsp. coracana]GJN00518.1 hypothetical protein PR202_ga17707 [Eleusine coracana subsp. coracana]